MLEVILEVLKHYAVPFSTGAILATLTALGYFSSEVLTSLFSYIKVAGEWETMLDRNDGKGLRRHEDARLYQLIHRVWGRTTTTAGHKYKVKGRITGDRMYLAYRATNGGADCGGCLLKIAISGKTMSGFELGSEQENDALYSYPYQWNRKA